MSRPSNYKTRQSEAILSYVASLGDVHVTAREIVEHFGRTGTSIGLATVYRHLDKLEREGKLLKHIVEGGASYQYTDCGHQECFHFKCESCGDLVHVECDEAREFRRHIKNEHAFNISPAKMVFYGTCKTCVRKET